MALPPELVEILVDPQDHQPLHYFENDAFLYNERRNVRYPIGSTGIVMLLADEALPVQADEQQRIVARIAAGESVVTGQRGNA